MSMKKEKVFLTNPKAELIDFEELVEEIEDLDDSRFDEIEAFGLAVCSY